MDLCFFCIHFFDFKHLDNNSSDILFRYAFDESNVDSIVEFFIYPNFRNFFNSEMAVIFRTGGFHLFDNLVYEYKSRNSLNPL